MRRSALLLSSLVVTTLFSISVSERVFLGVKYSFRTFSRSGEVILVDPFAKSVVFFNLEARKVTRTFAPLGNFIIGIYEVPDGFIVVDRGEPSVFKIRVGGQIVRRVPLPRRAISSTFENNIVYVLLEGGTIIGFNSELSQVSSETTRGNPSYVFVWNGRVLVTHLWSESIDFQFLGETHRDVGLMTPSIVVGDFLVDTRGGQLYNLRTGVTIKTAPYISSVHYDGTHYYACSMSNSTIYKLDAERVLGSFRVEYTPTNIKKLGDALVILSAPHAKVMVTFNERDVTVRDTGEYPLEVFRVPNGFAVYCSDSGEMWYYGF